jgi:peroxiredoxin-like protein
MKPLPHRYEVQLTGGQSGYAELRAAGIPLMRTASPPEYDGPGDAWSPEHLLLAAVESCFLFTLRAVARASQLEFVSLDLQAVGVVDRHDRVTRFTEIVLRPRLTIRTAIDRERIRLLLEKTEKACLISASLSTPIRLEPEIIEWPDAAAARGRSSEAA